MADLKSSPAAQRGPTAGALHSLWQGALDFVQSSAADSSALPTSSCPRCGHATACATSNPGMSAKRVASTFLQPTKAYLSFGATTAIDAVLERYWAAGILPTEKRGRCDKCHLAIDAVLGQCRAAGALYRKSNLRTFHTQ